MDMNMYSEAAKHQHRKVVSEFVDKYYAIMQQSPEQLFKFYKTQSSFTFSRETDGLSSRATGQEEIRHNIMYILQQFLGPISMISKNQIDHQASRQGGLIVHISGQLVLYDGYCQHFFQSFFLDEQTMPTPGYFVLTDYLRYVDASGSPSLPQCSPPGAQPGMQAGVPVMAPEAMLCQDQCLAPEPPQLGSMQMMQPHGVGQPQAWVPPPRLHPSMMHTVLPQQPPQQLGQMQVHHMMTLPGREPTSAGFPTVAQPLLQPVAATAIAAVESSPSDLGERSRLQDEMQAEVCQEPTKVADTPTTTASEAVRVETGHFENRENDEAEAEVAGDYEEDNEEYDAEQNRSEDVSVTAGDSMGTAKASDEREPLLDDGDPPEAQDSGGGDNSSVPAFTEEARENGSSEAAWAPGETSHGTSEEYPPVEEPRSWASMAGRLKEGGGQLVQSKVQGFGAPAGLAVASSPKAVSSGSTTSASRDRAAERSSGNSEKATGNSEYTVWLWVSRLPMDVPCEAQEVLDCITSYLGEAGRAIEFDRRDPTTQEWANIAVSSQEAADIILQISRDRKLLLRGKALKAEMHKSSYGSGRPRRAGGRSGGEGTSKGSGKSGRGAVADGGDDDRSENRGDGRGAGRGRRPRKGHSSTGEGTGKGGWTAATSNAPRQS
mmetsp:Transcript_17739/g.28865  ORF Transcript_17739/g.28865 Transcript_17739/m.28865 type:complete len:661 (+) Transcript_17739:70-2052(+)